MENTAWIIFKKYLITFLLKYVAGPYSWIATKLLPMVLEKYVKPHFFLVKRKIIKVIAIKEAKKKTERLENAETPDDYLDELNRK